MSRKHGEEIPAGPFIAWIERELERIRRDDTLREDNMTDVPARRVLADRLGVPERVVYRYHRGLRASSRDGVKGEYPTDTFLRAAVEDMLDHAGIFLWEVYPDLDDDDEPPRRVRGARITPTPHRLTEAQIRAAYVLYDKRGLSLPKLGDLLWRQLGYPSPKACAASVHRGFVRLGLPRRGQVEATVAANTKHGQARKASGYNAPYLRMLRAQRRAEHPCQHPGCRYQARPDSDFCGFHRPGFDEVRRYYARKALEAREARYQHPVTPELLEAARRLHHENGWSVSRAAAYLLDQSTVSDANYFGQLLRDALRERGQYLGPRPLLERHGALAA